MVMWWRGGVVVWWHGGVLVSVLMLGTVLGKRSTFFPSAMRELILFADFFRSYVRVRVDMFRDGQCCWCWGSTSSLSAMRDFIPSVASAVFSVWDINVFFNSSISCCKIVHLCICNMILSLYESKFYICD